MCSTIAGHPVDTIKVRMQMAERSTKQGVIRTMYNIIKQEGIMPFYRGVFPPTAVKSFTTMVFFTTNNYLKDNIIAHKRRKYIQNNEPVPDKIILSLWETFVSAAFCGFLLFPFISTGEFIKIQLQNDRTMADRPGKYRNMIHCTAILLRQRQLHRGMVCTAFRLIPGWGFYLLIYDAFNRYYDSQAVLGNNETLGSLSVSVRVLISGSMAGCIAWFLSYPMDYIKTNIQAHTILKWNYLHTKQKIAKPPRIRDVVGITMERYGVRGFFRGLSPCLIRAVPVNMTQFFVYETVLQLRKKRKNRLND